MSPPVPPRVGVDSELSEGEKLQSGLLEHLPNDCSLHGLTDIDEASGKGKSSRGVSPLNEDDGDVGLPGRDHLDDGLDGEGGGADALVLPKLAITASFFGSSGVIRVEQHDYRREEEENDDDELGVDEHAS